MMNGTVGVAVLAACVSVACVPLGSRGIARPLPAGQAATDVTFSASSVENSVTPSVAVDLRRGLRQHRELGVQLLNFTGISTSLTQQLTGTADPTAPAISLSVGAGHEFYTSRSMVRASGVRSWRGTDAALRYAGVQGIYQTPWFLTRWTNTRGAFAAGVFLGRSRDRAGRSRAVELSVSYAESVTDPGRRGLVIQPSITFRGPPRSRAR